MARRLSFSAMATAMAIAVAGGLAPITVAINGTWDESYGVDGVKDGANLPLVLKGPATLKFSYDDVTHKIGVAPSDLPGQATKADRALAGSSLRPPGA